MHTARVPTRLWGPSSVTFLSLLLASCAGERATSAPEPRLVTLRAEILPEPFASLVAEAESLPAASAGEWLSVHDEKGQSLAEFEVAPRRKPGIDGRVLALARLGPIGSAEERIFANTARYLEACYGLEVRFVGDFGPGEIPAHARRPARGHGPQIKSRFVLDSLLLVRRPDDALVFLALSTYDLYPRDDWNFVFGQAMPAKGVGVWSLARYGRRDRSEDEPIVLARMVRTATHEVGHLLGLAHCITWRCVMNGSNSLTELDARPLEFCPPCLAKVCISLDLDAAGRAGRTSSALAAIGLVSDAARARRMERRIVGVERSPGR